MFTLILLLNLCLGGLILIMGLKYYSTSFALSWLFPLVAFQLGYGQDIINKLAPYLELFNLQDPATINVSIWIFIGITTLITFLLSKILTYIYMPIIIVASVIALVISPFYSDSLPSFYGNIGAILVIVSWILLIVWKKIRAYIKTPMIGLLAGINIYLPISLLLTKAWNITLMPIITTILFFVIIPVAIALEIIVFAPRLNRKETEKSALKD